MKIPKKLFVRGYDGQGFGSGAIKWFTFGDISHVSLVFEFTDGSEEEFESIQGKGVCNHLPTTGKRFQLFSVPLTVDQIETAYENTLVIHGKYDWAGIWGFMVRKRRHSPSKWFCSEYVAYVLWKAGYALSRRDPYRETPSSVCESLRIKHSPKDEDINGV